MRSPIVCFAFVLLAGLALTASFLAAQTPYVYVNDNNPASGFNTATGFAVNTGPVLTLVPGSPFATTSTGFAAMPAPRQEVAISYGAVNCLYVADPFGTSTFPTGDVAAFTINAGAGALTLVGNYFDPSNTSGANKWLPVAVDRRVGFPYVFAAFTGERKIAFFKANTNTCQLSWASSTPAAGPTGFPAVGMAVSKAGPHVLVVTYGDGSVQSFKIGGGTLTPLAIFSSTGNINQGARPQSVDITKNGKYAVFGDAQTGPTEVEVAKILPGGTLAPTVDYGGTAVASGVNLGPGLDSENVWLSPAAVSGNFYLYITNNASGQVTTARISQVTGVVSPAGVCTSGFTNPTTLAPLTWTQAGGLHTIKTTSTGVGVAVAEKGSPSSVALLQVQTASGCTREVTGSPFTDPFSTMGLASVDVFPSRIY